jgi:hypothetical protein
VEAGAMIFRIPDRVWCWFTGHEAIIEQQRDSRGRIARPHAINWVCRFCGAVLGRTVSPR